MDIITEWVNSAISVLFGPYVINTLLITGVILTVMTMFGQWRAITHGTKVVMGKYDEKNDPGAINHFQALSTALSATVGLGNIAGVGLAVALGGPGAVFWMWIIGILGMALKMTEVTQSMLYRNTDDPKNPHGGPMFVAKYGFERMGFPLLGSIVGGLFVITLLISAATGGNMFQAWNVADTTESYWELEKWKTGLILAAVVGLVIIGGIKVIGRVAGIIVPFMCVIYIAAAVYVLSVNIAEVPHMFVMIIKGGLGYGDEGIGGAFTGAAAGVAMAYGLKRALFSSESGQGAAPIAHAAVRTDEPVREGIVAGLEPLIDTLVVCTITALVLLSTGAFNREAEARLASENDLVIEQVMQTTTDDAGNTTTSPKKNTWTLADTYNLPEKTEDARRILHSAIFEFEKKEAEEREDWRDGETVFIFLRTSVDADSNRPLKRVLGTIRTAEDGRLYIDWDNVESTVRPELILLGDNEPAMTPGSDASEDASEDMNGEATGDTTDEPTAMLASARQDAEPPASTQEAATQEASTQAATTQAAQTTEASITGAAAAAAAGDGDTEGDAEAAMNEAADDAGDAIDEAGDALEETGDAVAAVANDAADETAEAMDDAGEAVEAAADDFTSGRAVSSMSESLDAEASEDESGMKPIPSGIDSRDIYGDYKGSTLTAHAFDRTKPGLGKWLISIAVWLFAISTMISWSYYGEQGMVFITARLTEAGQKTAILIYKLIYIGLIIFTCIDPFDILRTDADIDMWTTLGLGVMLVVNIPLMWLFAMEAIKAYHNYIRRYTSDTPMHDEIGDDGMTPEQRAAMHSDDNDPLAPRP